MDVCLVKSIQVFQSTRIELIDLETLTELMERCNWHVIKIERFFCFKLNTKFRTLNRYLLIILPVLSWSSTFSGFKVAIKISVFSSLVSTVCSVIVCEWMSWSKGKEGLTRSSGLQTSPSRRIGAVHWQRPNKSGIRKSQCVFGSHNRQWACS